MCLLILVHLKKTMNNSNQAQAFIFAAGLGTRLKPITEKHPKPTIPLFNIPMGYYILPYLDQVQITKYIANTFHLPDQIHQLYKNMKTEFLFSDEKDFIKGSAGGLKQAEKMILPDVPVIVANSDEIFFTKEVNFLEKALRQHIEKKSLATLIVIEHPEAGHKFGGIWCEGKKVNHIGKDPTKKNLKPWHYIGLQILSPTVLKLIEPNKELNIFYDVLIHQLDQKDVSIYPITADWYETGNYTDYQLAKAEITKKADQAIYKNHFDLLKKYPKSNLSDLT